MSQLPSFKLLKPNFIFERTGVDCLGPINVRWHAKAKCEFKVWVVLFVDINIRFVYLDYVLGYDAECFNDTFERFTGRYCKPTEMISDSASSFQLYAKSLRLTQEKFFDQISTKNSLEWKFYNHTPWATTVEPLIKSTKRALKNTVLKDKLTVDSLNSILANVQGFLNRRPLLPKEITSENCVLTLCPQDFLIADTTLLLGRESSENDSFRSENLSSTVNESEDDASTESKTLAKLRCKFKTRATIFTRIFRLFSKFYMENLALRFKWQNKTNPLTRGSLVYVQDKKKFNPQKWPLGRITGIIKSRDNLIRSYEVTLGNGFTIRRPIQLLAPLELSHED